MKKINKKGFVLAETIVVGVFIVGLLTFIILNILPLIGDYEKVEKYDTLDHKYSVHLIRKMILIESPNKINDILSLNKDSYAKYDTSQFCLKFEHNNYCNSLLSQDYLDVKSIIITSYKTTALKDQANLASNNFNRSLKEYINYLPTHEYMVTTYARYEKYKRIIVEFNDGHFSNIEVKYE